MTRVTLKTIATETGFSVATVSRALAGYDDVSDSTRVLIRETADRLGYYPNRTARQLQSQRTEVIGFVLPDVSSQFNDPFFPAVVGGICDELARHHYDFLLVPLASEAQEMAIYERLVKAQEVDGILMNHGRRQDARVQYLSDHKMPFVLFGRTELPLDYPYIDVDGWQGTYDLTQHVIAQGHQRIAYLAAPQHLMHGHQRYKGYADALRDNDLPLDPAYVRHGNMTEASAGPAVDYFLGLPAPPTAIIAANDMMALGVLDRLKHHNACIVVAGFDDIPAANHLGLTTVRQPFYKIGNRLAAMLMALIQGQPLNERHILLQPEVVVRQSTRG